MDQSRLNDQDQPRDWLPAREAAAFLGVKPATLYSYASRGLLRRSPGPGGRRSLYLRADLERWKARHDARAGHGPVAAAALQYGEPVLDTRLAEVTAAGPVYRGVPALRLVAEGAGLEEAAELLWTGTRPETPPVWDGPVPRAWGREPLASMGHLMVAVAAMALEDPMRAVPSPSLELARARRLLGALAARLGGRGGRGSPPGLAERVAASLGARGKGAASLIDRALVLTLDHGQSASTFAARVAAGTGADLYACLLAGLAALSGPRHGGACDRIEALVREVLRARGPEEVLRGRLHRGEAVPGFGHRLYPDGDPRTAPLLAGARAAGGRRRELRALLATCERMRAWGQPAPGIDMGLVAVALGLGLPPGSATLLFALGRLAGFVGHVLEQREQGLLLRPRGRYVGDMAPDRAGGTPRAP